LDSILPRDAPITTRLWRGLSSSRTPWGVSLQRLPSHRHSVSEPLDFCLQPAIWFAHPCTPLCVPVNGRPWPTLCDLPSLLPGSHALIHGGTRAACTVLLWPHPTSQFAPLVAATPKCALYRRHIALHEPAHTPHFPKTLHPPLPLSPGLNAHVPPGRHAGRLLQPYALVAPFPACRATPANFAVVWFGRS